MIETGYSLYFHMNNINGKKYVGITRQKFGNRFRSGKGYNRHPCFYADITKYGWNNFKHIILHRNLTFEVAKQLEKLYISIFHSRETENGYNMTDGGLGLAGHHMREDSIEKRSAKRRGRKANPNQLRGLEIGHKLSKPIYCIDEDGNRTDFDSIVQARNIFNKLYLQSNFKAIVNGHRKVCGRYWFYKGE